MYVNSFFRESSSVILLLRNLIFALVVTHISGLQAQDVSSQTHKPLPNTVELRREPLPYKPFTLQELRQYKKNLTYTSKVVLDTGKKVTARDLIDQLNAYEKLLTSYGYSLRDPGEEPQVLDRTYVRLYRRDSFKVLETKPESSTITRSTNSALQGKLSQFPEHISSWSIMDPSLFGAKLEFKETVSNAPSRVGLESTLDLKGYVLDKPIDLVQVKGSATLPSGMAVPDDMRSATINFAVFGQGIINNNATDDGSGIAQTSFTSPIISKDLPPWTYYTSIGPIPIELNVGFRAYAQASMQSSAHEHKAIYIVNTNAAASVYFQALASLGVIAAGGETAMDILKYSYELNNTVTLQKKPEASTTNPSPQWESTLVSWDSGDGYQIESGSGSFSIMIRIGVWRIKKTYKKEIIAWDGYVWSENLNQNPTLSLLRPAGCGTGTMQSSMCSLPPNPTQCKNLSTDVSNCGGCGVVCLEGQNCSGGNCFTPQKEPKGHTCPHGTQCCEIYQKQDGSETCLGPCYRPGAHSQCP